ncbi:hypothetical protein E2R56_30005 [Rhodococcus qingshengii]|nr:hypothetical protein E2R56_30005 [Rhodococcus qingshengii]
MKITSEVGQSVIEEMQKITEHNINFINDEGIIIASMDSNRIGDVHDGALQVLQTKQKVVVYEENQFSGAKPGVNFPINLGNQIVGVIGITGVPQEVNRLGEVIQKMTEILIKEAYLEQQTDLEELAKTSFVDEWVHGKWENDKLFASRGWILGINVHLPRVAVILDPIGFHDMVYEKLSAYHADVQGELEVQKLRQEILSTIRNHFYHLQDIIFPFGSSKYVVLMTVNDPNPSKKEYELLVSLLERIRQDIKNKYSFDIAISVGTCQPDMYGVSKSFKEADSIISFAKRQKEILFYHQLGIETFIEDISTDTRKNFIERILQMDRSSKDFQQLVETLDVFFQANQSIQEASEKLYIHKNTLQYRLKKISERTGYDPRHFIDAVLLYIAIKFYNTTD